MEWKTVYVFVSSTFNDMHAERDLLVKRVFPELRLWCARRKLQLRDIDLRWGVSEADAQENKRVVEVCLRNIDKCRPFFLCFMGQRRGWVPREEDVNPETLEAFPQLRSCLGEASVTEMEVLHALLQPFSQDASPVRHARFYFRDPAYTKALHTQAHKNLFIPGRSIFRNADKGMDTFQKRLAGCSTAAYTARWNPELPSPELTGALSKGRLEDFRVGSDTLETDVLQWLKDSISREYPDHQQLPPAASELERELDRQDTQMFQYGDGYIPRPVEEQALARSLEAAGSRPLVLLARAGCGKTSLLAAFLRSKQPLPVYYRFVGTTPQSFRLEDLSASLVEQWVQDGLLPKSVLEYTRAECKLIFSALCTQAAQARPFLLVLDGLDQLFENEDWQTWLPGQMPQGSSLLVSLRDTGAQLPDSLSIHRLGLMTNPQDKAMMVSAYLGSFLKDIDEKQMQQLLAMEGSDNPLYMKIVLNELRQHGSFDTLMELFRRDYGSTPDSAFSQVLTRVERELEDTFFDPGGAMLLFFGCLAHARQGLDGQLFLWACRNLKGWDKNTVSDRQVLDLVYGLARELEPFLVLEGDRIALRYDSLRRAINRDKTELYGRFANILLAQGFLNRLCDSNQPEDARTVLTHTVEATDDYIHSLIRDPRRITLLVRCAGAQTVAKTCDKLVQQRDLPEYADVAKVLYKASARLDTNPNTLFMELDRFGDQANPAVSALLEESKHYDTGVLLRPRHPANAAGALSWEYAFPESSMGCQVWAEPYLVTVSQQVLQVVDLRSRETVHVMHLSHLYDGGSVSLAAQKDILYVCRFPKDHAWVQIFSYRLSDMHPVQPPVTVACPYGNPWQLHAHNGKLYAMQYERNGADADGGCYSVTCLHTGKLLYREESKRGIQYRFWDGWFVFRNDGSGICRVMSLENGEIAFEDQFLGRDRFDPEREKLLTPYTKLFANTGNMQAAGADKLYIWFSGSRIRPDGGIQLLQRMHRLAPENGSLTLEKTWDDKVAHHSAFANLKDSYLVVESQGYLEIMDGDCRLLGKLDLGEAISHASQSNTMFALFEEQLLIFHKDKVRSYDLKRLLRVLKKDLEEPFVGRRSSAIIRDRLYVMDLQMESIDLETLELTREPYTGKQYWEQYDPWNMRGRELWIGYGMKTGLYTIKRPELMDRVLRFKIDDADRRELRHAFLYKDAQQVCYVALLEADLKKTKRTVGKETKDFSRLWLRTKPLAKLDQDIPWTQKDLNAEITDYGIGMLAGPTSVTVDEKPFLILPNVYKDPQTIQLLIYDLLEDTVYPRDVDLSQGKLFYGINFHVYPGGVMYELGQQEEGCLEIVDLSVPKIMVLRRWAKILTRDSLAEKICLLDRNSRELLLLDTTTNQLTVVTTLEKGFRPELAVLLDRYVVVSQQLQDTVRIYDRESGKLLCTQRLEVALSDAMVHEATGTVVMVDSNSRKYFWALEAYEQKPE